MAIEELIHFLVRHGYALLFAWVLADQLQFLAGERIEPEEVKARLDAGEDFDPPITGESPC